MSIAQWGSGSESEARPYGVPASIPTHPLLHVINYDEKQPICLKLRICYVA